MNPASISGTSRYHFKEPSMMWNEDDDPKKRRDDLFNRWLLIPLKDGKHTGLINETLTDISSTGMIARMMMKKLPALQISIDLSQSMIMANEIQKWAEGK